MRTKFVCIRRRRASADLRLSGEELREALAHERADAVMRCAVLMALASLANGGNWPEAAIESMAVFMGTMKASVVGATGVATGGRRRPAQA